MTTQDVYNETVVIVSHLGQDNIDEATDDMENRIATEVHIRMDDRMENMKDDIVDFPMETITEEKEYIVGQEVTGRENRQQILEGKGAGKTVLNRGLPPEEYEQERRVRIDPSSCEELFAFIYNELQSESANILSGYDKTEKQYALYDISRIVDGLEKLQDSIIRSCQEPE